VVCSNDLSLEWFVWSGVFEFPKLFNLAGVRKKPKGVRTIRRMLEGAESEGCWRVQNPSSISVVWSSGQ
jgi:hypothetical protein